MTLGHRSGVQVLLRDFGSSFHQEMPSPYTRIVQVCSVQKQKLRSKPTKPTKPVKAIKSPGPPWAQSLSSCRPWECCPDPNSGDCDLVWFPVCCMRTVWKKEGGRTELDRGGAGERWGVAAGRAGQAETVTAPNPGCVGPRRTVQGVSQGTGRPHRDWQVLAVVCESRTVTQSSLTPRPATVTGTWVG